MIIFLYLFNSTYQAYVPIFVDMEMVSEYTFLCRIWEVVRIIEALSIFISFIIYVPFFKMLHTSGRFHINLRRIFEFVSLHLFFNQLLRLVLLFYEGQAVLGDAVTFCDTVIFIIGLIRCYTLLFLASIVPLITLERLMATIYLWDYEKSPRTYISLSIMLSSVLIFLTLSTCSCIAIAYDMLRTVIGVVISLLGAILLSGMLCAFLFTYNSKVLIWLDRVQQHERVESLTPRFGHRPYDLSVRYQIKENMRVFVILRRFLIITIISETFGSITGGIAFTAFESDSIIGQVMLIGVDLMLTLSFTTFPFGVLWIVKEWREKYNQWWRHLFRTNKSVSVASSLVIPSIDYAGDTNKYFDYYRQNW